MRHIIKVGKKDFSRNKILNTINLLAIVSALILITLASSWTYLTFSPITPADNAKNFYWLEARDQSGKWKSVTVEDCEKIEHSVQNGYVWFWGQRFILLTLNRNNKKVSYKITSTDLNFWKALNFDFIYGSPFSEEQYNNREYVTVISDRMAKAYFGTTEVVGKYFVYGKFRFKVQGVFKAVTLNHYFTYDIYIPHSLMPESAASDINPIFVANDKQGFTELDIFLKKYNKSNNNESGSEIYTTPYIFPILHPSRDHEQLGSLLAAFILPILCFANLFTRKMELKIPEMAIKRALGATRVNIFMNLITENLLYISIAGIIALVIAHPLIGFAFNPTGTERIATDFLTFRFYLFTLLLYLLFGIFSALRPAWEVSGRSIISTLNYA